METSWRYIALLVLVGIIKNAFAVSLTFCSGSNTADDNATYSQFQTNGLCSDSCGSDYAYAITQDSSCWCSNLKPADTVSNSACNQKCPGYPFEYCGGTGGQYAYIALGKDPIGTVGGGSSTGLPSQAKSTVLETAIVTSVGKVTKTSTGVVFVTITNSPSAVSSFSDSTSSRRSTTATATQSGSGSSQTPSAVTSIVTLPGQTQVSTIIISPSTSATADTSPLGQGASVSPSTNGLSKGAVAGLAVGVALGVSLIAGILIFFLLRRMKQQREESEATLTPEMVGGAGGTPSSMSRHTSTMSQSGLLNKNPRINTRNLSYNWSSQAHSAASTSSPTGTGNRRSIGADQRLDPHHAIYTNEDLRHSDVSLQDNTDYSRKILSVRNRGDGEVDDD